MNKGVILAVTNDLSGDQRVHKVATSLLSFGYEPVLVGRKLPHSVPLNRAYRCVRFSLPIRKGPLFYAAYNIRLWFFLIFSDAGIFLANDLDTLPAVWLAGRLRRRRIVYDSHEYFTEVPELVGRPSTRKIWESLEKRIFPHLNTVYTVNQSIADIYSKKYGVRVGVVRNVPLIVRSSGSAGSIPDKFNGYPLILYQGAVNVGRGLEQLVDAMALMPDCRLIVAGDGDIRLALERRVSELGLSGRIHFAGRVPFEQLSWYTDQASLGVSLEQDIGLNYHYALPNKLFDYMHAGLPVIASDLPEIRKVVEDANFGQLISRFDPEYLSSRILAILNDKEKLKTWRENALAAAPRYTWENEEQILKDYFPPV